MNDVTKLVSRYEGRIAYLELEIGYCSFGSGQHLVTESRTLEKVVKDLKELAPTYRCPFCENTFEQAELLKFHLDDRHGARQRF